MKRLAIGIALVGALAGCAPGQQQTAIPPSPTGCYYRVPALALYGVIPLRQPRYEPAPCNVINGDRSILSGQGGGSASLALPMGAGTPNVAEQHQAQMEQQREFMQQQQEQFEHAQEEQQQFMNRNRPQLCFGAGAFEQCQ